MVRSKDLNKTKKYKKESKMYNFINELLLFPSGDNFIVLSIIVAMFIVFMWWFMMTSKKDVRTVEYFAGFFILIYGMFIFYPYMQNSIKNSFLLFDGPTKNIGITQNDLIIPGILIVMSFLILLLVRPGVDKFYRIYGYYTFFWISFRKRIIDIIVSGNLEKNEQKNNFRFWNFWKMFRIMFYTSLILFLTYELLEGCMHGIYLATGINNLFFVVLTILLFQSLYKKIGGMYMSGLAKQPFVEYLPIRFQKRESLKAFVSNNTPQDTKDKGIEPVYTWPLKIIIVLSSIITMWFLYEIWKAGVTKFFGNYDEFIRITIYGIGDRGFWDFVIHFLWFPFKSIVILLFGTITLNKFVIPDMRLVSDPQKTNIIGPKNIHGSRGVYGYCSYEHSSSSILAIFGWVIASIGIFYPVVLGIFMFFMIFRSYSAIDLNSLSNPNEKTSGSAIPATA